MKFRKIHLIQGPPKDRTIISNIKAFLRKLASISQNDENPGNTEKIYITI